jgi:hypothetical protein
MYIRAIAKARVTGLSSPVVEVAKAIILTKSDVVEERHHKDLYS